jgi:hypothetical protein
MEAKQTQIDKSNHETLGLEFNKAAIFDWPQDHRGLGAVL